MSHYSRCAFWLAVFVTIAVAQPGRAAAGENAKPKRPNILFIYTDDQSYRTLSCYPEAYPFVRTPNIDRLAQMGIRFTAAYNGSWCAPSRASILTGHHPFGVHSMTFKGQYPSSSYDPQQCRFWPSIFRRLGYFTAQIGKWHTGADAGFGRDWDYQAVWNRPAHPDNAPNYYKKQLISFNGAKPTFVDGYPTDNYTNWAVDFIKGKDRDKAKPWFLWLCYGATHGPFTPAERHRQAYAGAKIETPVDLFGARLGKPEYVQKMDVWAKGKSGEPIYKGKSDYQDKEGQSLAEGVRQYNECALAIDEGVARLLQALEETGQLENTLIVFTSDQGYAWGEHGFRHKLGPYDATIRSPLIFSMPGTLPKGKTCGVPVSGVDFAPTFFRFAGFELPWKMHGRDLVPLLKDPGRPWNEPMLVTHTGRSFGKDTDDPAKADILEGVPWWVALRSGKTKYIRTLVENEIEELYDLHKDPEELTNLALQAEHRALLERMRAMTIAELRRTGAGFVDRMPTPKTVQK
ncbi:MAG: sulfatase-like hydrolase/transferase [Gemmataceae bacterium]|nr:sulfatase-like hydrolase/transferase [Gemmataceae bacterium]MCI0739110.1 sulfatase-like hydrolase/transferase [Gemmataceae bacterium]